MQNLIERTIRDNPDGSKTDSEYFEPTKETLEALLRDLFERHWSEIRFGPHVQGSVFEIEMSKPPEKITYLDGYLTVDSGPAGHFHLCIGEHRGSAKNPTPPDLAAWRRCGKAALFRLLDPAGRPRSWGIDMSNGRGEEMLTIWLPNPWIAPHGGFTREPDWSRLSLYNDVRERLFGERGPDRHDGPAPSFQH